MDKPSRSVILISSAAVVFSLLTAGAIWFFSTDTAQHSCVINSNSCEIQTADTTLQVILDTKPAPEEQINFTLNTPSAFHVQDIQLEGDDMYMGRVPVFIKSNEGNSIKGWFMLGSCSQSHMRWRMVIKVKGHTDPFTVYLDV